MMKINGFVQGAGDVSTTKHYNPGKIYQDEDTDINYQYVYASTHISAYFGVEIYSMVAGTTCKVKKAATTSTTMGDGVPQVALPAGYYGFVQKTGPAEGYVASSVAAGSVLQNSASTAGLFQAKTSTIAQGVARALETGLGASTTTGIQLMYPC